MRNRIAILFIIVGIGIAIFPLADRLYTWYWQARALDSYAQLDQVFVEELATEETEISPVTEGAIGQTSTNAAVSQTSTNTAVSQTSSVQPKPDPAPVATPIGVLTIEKINLKLPILEGATNQNMKVGVGWLRETTKIGETGNVALAAHRSYTYGRFFNRLDEIVVGDQFMITANGTEYHYEVFGKLVVLPTDTSVLKRNNRDKIVTLITCTPIRKATHRLIIQGKLIE